ncbi:hypothetical protein IPN35_03315 [Candidatus Peregrinibacteria bacterium]|nr:MAG: hypothetical protein IPN35_03315 [Candidatus Peregrinibacteria bacterium]
MSKAIINFVHLCDLAFLSQEGKLNIIGIFENISSAVFPACHPKISLVMNVTLEKGEYPLLVRVVHEKNNEELAKISGKISCQKTGNVGIIHEFQNLSFSKPGQYAVEIWINNEPAGEKGKIVFSVSASQKK